MGRVCAVMKTAQDKHKEMLRSLEAKRQQIKPANNDTLIDIDDADTTLDDAHVRVQLQTQLRSDIDRLKDQNERQFAIENEVREVQHDVVEINQIMRDMGNIVSEQSPIIKLIERQVIDANDHIIAGNEQLTSASGHQKKYRTKLCWLIIILLIVAVIITVAIVLGLKLR